MRREYAGKEYIAWNMLGELVQFIGGRRKQRLFKLLGARRGYWGKCTSLAGARVLEMPH